MAFFASWLTTPMMLGAGALAVASPILIHLLNKRRFKIVRWAAMDFLLNANKKNRRRVQLENFIILLLRCLAMLLLGLLLARPFLPNSLTNLLQNTRRVERVVVLDDSISMLASEPSDSPWIAAIEGLKSLTREMAVSRTDDSLTVVLSSRPDTPLMVGREVDSETLESVLLELESIHPSDLKADFRGAFDYVDGYVRNKTAGLNRVVYVLTDRRKHDWADGSDGQDVRGPAGRLQSISKIAAGCFLIDLPVTNENNLAVVAVRQERQWVSGAVVRLEVDVKNWGTRALADAKVELRIGQAMPLVEMIDKLAAGQTKTVVFQHVFDKNNGRGVLEGGAGSLSLFDRGGAITTWDVSLQVDVSVKTATLDGLKEDSRFFYVGRILNQIPILLVRGTETAVASRSETYALAPLAGTETGILADVVSDGELESVSLSKYKVIFLCSVDLVSEDRLAALEQWTRDGGNLIFMPGSGVKPSLFNQTFYNEGKGLCPVQLTRIHGDPTRQTSVRMQPDPQPHPFLEKLTRIDKGIFSGTNIFSWWGSVLSPEIKPTLVTVPMRLDDEGRAPAIVDYQFGRGRTVYYCMAAGMTWSDWPASQTYIVTMYEMIRELVDDSLEIPVTQVGRDFLQTVDLGRFSSKVTLIGPKQQTWETNAQPAGTWSHQKPSKDAATKGPHPKAAVGSQAVDTKNAEPKEVTDVGPGMDAKGADDTKQTKATIFYEAMFRSLPKRGIYQIRMKSNQSQGVVRQQLACNLDPTEGDLAMVNRETMVRWVGDDVKMVPIAQMTQQSIQVAKDEFWFQVLVAIGIVLGLEQFLACWFGSKR